MQLLKLETPWEPSFWSCRSTCVRSRCKFSELHDAHNQVQNPKIKLVESQTKMRHPEPESRYQNALFLRSDDGTHVRLVFMSFHKRAYLLLSFGHPDGGLDAILVRAQTLSLLPSKLFHVTLGKARLTRDLGAGSGLLFLFVELLFEKLQGTVVEF